MQLGTATKEPRVGKFYFPLAIPPVSILSLHCSSKISTWYLPASFNRQSIIACEGYTGNILPSSSVFRGTPLSSNIWLYRWNWWNRFYKMPTSRVSPAHFGNIQNRHGWHCNGTRSLLRLESSLTCLFNDGNFAKKRDSFAAALLHRKISCSTANNY